MMIKLNPEHITKIPNVNYKKLSKAFKDFKKRHKVPKVRGYDRPIRSA